MSGWLRSPDIAYSWERTVGGGLATAPLGYLSLVSAFYIGAVAFGSQSSHRRSSAPLPSRSAGLLHWSRPAETAIWRSRSTSATRSTSTRATSITAMAPARLSEGTAQAAQARQDTLSRLRAQQRQLARSWPDRAPTQPYLL